MKYRPDIDGLRAVAVLAVVAFHAFPDLLPGGYAGVDVFFVVSGFLITGLLRDEIAAGGLSIAGFYERRARRILPALLVLLAAATAAAWLILLPKELMEFSYALRGSAVFAANFALADLVDYFAGPAELQPLLHIWSLGVEEQFYLVYPLVLWLLLRRAPGATVPALAALALLSFAAAVWGVGEAPENAFFLPHMRMWELLAGGLLALGAAPPIRSRSLRAAAAAAGLALLIAAFALTGPDAGYPSWPALAPVAGTALLIHAGASGANPVSSALAARPAVKIGLISYSLYLWHWPLLVFPRHLSAEGPGATATLALVATAFLAAWLSWRCVERPFRGKDGLLTRRGVFAASALGIAALLAAGYAGKLTSGAPWRFGPELQDLLNARAAYFDGRGRACGERTGEIAAAATPEAAASRACRIGPEAGPARFLLWGDSLAMALQPAVEDAAQAAGDGGLALARSACAPLPGFVRRDDAKSRECQDFNAMVLRIAALPEIEAVVITGGLDRLFRDGEGGEDGPALRARFLDTVRGLSEAGKQVILVAPAPFAEIDAPTALARAARFGTAPPEGPTLEAHLADLAPMTGAMEEAAALPGVRTVWPWQAFCKDGRCALERDGRTLYADALHPSPDGARLVAPALTEALRASLPPG